MSRGYSARETNTGNKASESKPMFAKSEKEAIDEVDDRIGQYLFEGAGAEYDEAIADIEKNSAFTGNLSVKDKFAADLLRAMSAAKIDTKQYEIQNAAEKVVEDGAIFGDDWHDGPGSGKFEGIDPDNMKGEHKLGTIDFRGKKLDVFMGWSADFDRDDRLIISQGRLQFKPSEQSNKK